MTICKFMLWRSMFMVLDDAATVIVFDVVTEIVDITKLDAAVVM